MRGRARDKMLWARRAEPSSILRRRPFSALISQANILVACGYQSPSFMMRTLNQAGNSLQHDVDLQASVLPSDEGLSSKP